MHASRMHRTRTCPQGAPAGPGYAIVCAMVSAHAVHPSPYTPAGWRALPLAARRLMAARALRSIGQGALAVDFVLYLRALGWSVAAVGILFAASALAGAGLGLLAGPASDRLGRRRFLLGYQALLALGTLVLVLLPTRAVIVTTAVLLGLGRGANGAAGPFAPVEQAWLAQVVPGPERPRVFSLNGAIGFWGMGLGSLLGSGVHLWQGLLPGAAAFMPLLGLSLVVAVLNYLQIRGLSEVLPGRSAEGGAVDLQGALATAPERELRRHENRALGLLAAVNAVNALGIGMFSPLLPYWFALRFGVGPAAIGSVYALAFVLTGLSSLATGELAQRVGLVASVAWVRLVGVALLVALPLMPAYLPAAVLYVVRSVLNRGTTGARQAFGVGLVRDGRRGLASSLNAASQRLPQAVGPAIGGWMLSLGELDLPFFVAAGLQLLYVVLFATVLGPLDGGSGTTPATS